MCARIMSPIEGCGFHFQDLDRLAMHLVMAAGDSHLVWKAEHLSAVHTLENTHPLKQEAIGILPAILEDQGD